MKKSQTPFWNNFGTVAVKIEILEHRPGTPGGFFMPSSGAEHPQYTPLPLLFVETRALLILTRLFSKSTFSTLKTLPTFLPMAFAYASSPSNRLKLDIPSVWKYSRLKLENTRAQFSRIFSVSELRKSKQVIA